MKQLAPSGWVGVLIGIVLFGIIVAQVAATNSKCWKKSANNVKIETVDELTKAFTPAGWKEECDGGQSCLQYYPNTLTKGKVSALVECGSTCGNAGAIMGATGYTCNSCNTASGLAACKDVSVVKQTREECYIYKGPKNKANILQEKTYYCTDGCKHEVLADSSVVMGCAEDCKNFKSPASDCNTACTGTVCKDLIAAPPMCYKLFKDTLKLDTVNQITEAYTMGKWLAACEPTEKCLQYYPERSSETDRLQGKVHVYVECGSDCLSSRDGPTRIGKGYKCHECDSRRPDACKKIDIMKGVVTECYNFTGSKNSGDTKTLPKIYCNDKCQFSETADKITVGCAKDISGGKDCPVGDPLCEKMIDKTSGGGNSNSGGGDSTGTTRAPRNSNKLTSSACLISSMVTLLFAASQYRRLF